ncbi:MAG: PAS domain-containing protein [Candidatus Eisenbacteria bacterium]|nr:PAS domain-containing protein [Candidatus Eisenbacteria bacterium]
MGTSAPATSLLMEVHARPMARRRSSHTPVISIVVGILILAVVLTVVSFRDIERGRAQVSSMLEHQARGVLAFIGADLRAGLSAGEWDPERFSRLFEDAASRPQIAFVGLLAADGRVLAHSDSELVGGVLESGIEPTALFPGQRLKGTRITYDGRSAYSYAAIVEVVPRELCDPASRWRMPGHPRRRRHTCSPEEAAARLSELLGRDVGPDSAVRLIGVIALESSSLESTFLASRNHTIMTALVLLAVGAVAIYFLFIVSHYRSVRSALESMRTYTTNVIESMASGLLSVDADGRVVTVNGKARRMLGLASDPRGRPVSEILRLEPESADRALGTAIAGARDELETEATVTTPDRGVPVALSASTLRDEDGRRSGAVVLFQDLSEVEDLKDRVKRERHLASLGRLAAGVAHEVRNPLSSLKGFAQFLRSRFVPGSREERYADIMIEEVERLDRVVQELLDFARPVEPDRTAVSPNAVVEDALALLSEDAAFGDITIERRLDDGAPDVLVDAQQLRQALLNVFLNGIEAMESGGRLTVETQSVGEGDRVAIRVSDTGPGLTDEELAKLFEPFYTTKDSGTGLGLTIVSRVLEQNDGSIVATSEKGSGTTFTIELPAARREE